MPSLTLPANLKRYPRLKRDLLQAWDGADELILAHLSENGGTEALAGRRVLIVNDAFGALACALEGSGAEVTSYTDSYVSFRATGLNSGGRVAPLSRLDELSGNYDLVLLRIPKNMSFLEDILAHLSEHLSAGARLICGYMVKHQANAAFELIDRYVGPTTTSLARKKARLIFASFERAPRKSPYPLQVPIEGFAEPFVNHSNLFSREKLDIGTRFLLDHLPVGDFRDVLDLGCGNGILGIAVREANPAARVIFSDESRMAIESARANFARVFPDAADAARFHWIHAFEDGPDRSVDLVLCNPPFHQGTTIGDFVARQMFSDARRVLRPGGTLRVVANSHLKHQVTLRQIFGESEVVAKNSKFLIVDAVAPVSR